MFKTFLLVGASAMALAATSAEAVTFVYTGAVQSYTTPAKGIYDVYLAGAKGGDAGFPGGRGASVEGAIALDIGTKISVIVGGQGGSVRSSGSAGGGGGTLISIAPGVGAYG